MVIDQNINADNIRRRFFILPFVAFVVLIVTTPVFYFSKAALTWSSKRLVNATYAGVFQAGKGDTAVPPSIVEYIKADQLKIQNDADGTLRAWSKVKGMFSPESAIFRPRDEEQNWQVAFLPLILNGVPLHRSAPHAQDNVVRYSLGQDVVELYENREEGIEQRFVIKNEELRIKKIGLELIGMMETDLVPERLAGEGIMFKDADGVAQFRYGEATLVDAQGKKVPMELAIAPKIKNYQISLSVAPTALVGLKFPLTIDPLLTTPATTLDPTDQTGSGFGAAVSTAGDVNGDGYSDVIVGASGFDADATGEGRAYIYHGSSTGLSSTPALTLDPTDQANALFGDAVSTAGDVNDDEYSDVIITAFGVAGEANNQGRVYVYHGSSTGLSSTPAIIINRVQDDSSFGRSISTAGDVNGDGYSDIIVGADGYDGSISGEGAVHVYHGSATGLPSTPNTTLEPTNQANSSFGFAVGLAGDVNGDTYSDIIIGAYQWDGAAANEGIVYIYEGSATGVSSSATLPSPAEQASSGFGISVATAGDVNGDGYTDVIAGSSTYDGGATDEGSAYIYYGASGGISAGSAPNVTLEPTDQASANFGSSVSTAGDVNGDGYSDVIVGASSFDADATDEGRVYIYYGASGGLATASPLTLDPTNQADANFGRSVFTAGDIDGDGYSDAIVGASGFDTAVADEGRVYLFRGSADDLEATASWTADPTDQADPAFGWSVASAGDVNGDGYSDVIVGAPDFTANVNTEGRVYVFYGSSTGLSTTADWTADPVDQVNARFGYAVAGAGDVNGDGYSDVLISAPKYDGEGTDEGRAYVYYGSSTGLSATPDWTADPLGGDDGNFGVSVQTAGDVNGDGYSDIYIGSSNNSQTTRAGRGDVYYGSSTGLAATPAWTFNGENSGDRFGPGGTAGDVNGDGFSDLIVGAFLSEGSGVRDEGRAYAFYGSITGLSATADWTVDPTNQDSAQFGFAAATIGDVNGDGYSDVAVSASLFDSEATDEGRVYIYHGSSTGLATTAALTLDPTDQASAQFGGAPAFNGGRSVMTAGDVNGDGYSDVIVGAPAFDETATDEGRAYLYLGSSTGLASTAAWTADPTDQADADFGEALATAGDVNGDGYADVIISAKDFGTGVNTSDEGRAYQFYGGGGRGLALAPRQRLPNAKQLIAPLGISNTNEFNVILQGRTPAGRGSVKVEIEAKPDLTAFDGTGTTVGSATSLPVSGASLGSTVTGLQAGGTPYHWRTRIHYNQSPITYLGGQVSRWIYFGGNGAREMDFRTANAAPTISNLEQLTAAGTVIGEGGQTAADDMVLRATVTDDDPGSSAVRIQTELKTTDNVFTGSGLEQSSLGSSGATASVSYNNQAVGRYHWRARVQDRWGLTSSFSSFGSNADGATDFQIVSAAPSAPLPVVSPSQPTAAPAPAPSTTPTTQPTQPTEPGPPAAPTMISGEARSDTVISWNFTDNAADETGFVLHDSEERALAQVDEINLSFINETGLIASTEYCNRHVHALRVSTLSAASANFPCTTTLPPPPALTLAKSVASISQPGGGVTTASVTVTSLFGILAGLFLLNLVFIQAHHASSPPGRRLLALLPLILTSSENAYMYLRACGPEGCQGPHFSRHRRLHRLSRASLAGMIALGLMKLLMVVAFASIVPALRVDGQTLVAPPGSAVTFQLNFSNTGGSRASSVVIRDAIPEGTEYVGGSLTLNGNPWPAMFDGGRLIVELAELGPQNSGLAQFQVRVLGGAPETIENQATIGAREVSPPVASNIVMVATVAPSVAEQPREEMPTVDEAPPPTPPPQPPAPPAPPAPAAPEADATPQAPTASPSAVSGGGGLAPSEVAPPAPELAIVPEPPTVGAGAGVGPAPVIPETAVVTVSPPAPPTVVEEAVAQALDKIEQVAPVVGKTLKTVNRVTLDNPKVETANQTVVVPVIIATGATSAGVVASSVSFLPYLQYLFTQPLLLFTRRRRRQWGTVYNAITKMPVDLAVVRLLEGTTGALQQTKVTDKHGRFFFLPAPGTYRLEVVKQNFVYPSTTLTGKIEDGTFSGLYFGSTLIVKQGEAVAPNIPLDPTVAQEAPAKVVLKMRAHQAQHLLSGASIVAGVAAFLITPKLLTLGFLALHTALYRAFRALAYPSRPKGLAAVLDAERGTPLGGAIARIFDTTYNKLLETQVTDRAGRYGFLVGRNAYYVMVEKEGYLKEQTPSLDLTAAEKPQVVSVEVKMKRA